MSLHLGAVQIHCKEERWLTQVLPAGSTQHDLGEAFSIATTMDELSQGHTAHMHAVSRVKQLLNMTTVSHIFVSKAHESAKL